MGCESFDVVSFELWPLLGSLALVSCRFGGYKFALVLRCVGLVLFLLFRFESLKIFWN